MIWYVHNVRSLSRSIVSQARNAKLNKLHDQKKNINDSISSFAAEIDLQQQMLSADVDDRKVAIARTNAAPRTTATEC